MRTGVTLSITSADLERLRALVGDRNAPQKHVWRARIVLLSGEVLGTNAIMRETGKSKTCVWRWQERSPRRAQRLLRDKTRPSRIPKLDTAIAERGVALTMEPPLAEAQAFPMDRRPRQNHRRRPTRVPNVRFDPLERRVRSQRRGGPSGLTRERRSARNLAGHDPGSRLRVPRS